jgi:uncharacterized membrane protein YesL
MNKFVVPQRSAAEWLCKIGTFFGLSLCWLLCCVPVITIIPAGVALYDTVVHCLFGKDEHPFRRFFKDFKSELLRGMGLSLIWVVVGVVYFMGFWFLSLAGKENQILRLCFMFYAGTLLIPLSLLSWLIPLESRFALGVGGLHKMAMMLSLVKLPRTAACLGMLVAAVLIIFIMPVMMVLLPAIYATLQAVLIENTLIGCEEPEEPAEGNA